MVITPELAAHEWNILFEGHKVDGVDQIDAGDKIELMRIQCFFVNKRLSRLEEPIIINIKSILIQTHLVQGRDRPIYMEPVIKRSFQI